MARSVSALVPYYGSKRQMAKGIVEALGPHHAYLNPFCGSLAVELAKKPSRMEVVNDFNGALVNLARIVQEEESAVKLYEQLYRTAFSESLYEESREKCVAYFMDDPRPNRSLDWAYHYFVVSWMGRNGFVGSEREFETGFCKRFTSGGGDPATRFRNAVAGVPWWHERFRNLTILSEDGIALCYRFEDEDGAVIYADPPYLCKAAKYQHDFACSSDDPNAHPLVKQYGDHGRLALSLTRFKRTRVILSYYEHPALAELYPGWHKLFVKVPKNLSQSANSTGKAADAPEVLLSNLEFLPCTFNSATGGASSSTQKAAG